MVHKIILTAVTGSLFLLSGCGQVAPDMGAKKSNAYNADTVSIDESGYGGSGVAANGNSSSDGFQSIYFGFDQYGISPDMEAYMTKNANVASATGRRVKIEGNCDEFGSDEYNYALGLKRAKAVKDALAIQGISPSQMVMVSYGESNPVCNDPSENCYARNRRVDLRLAQ